MQAAGGAGALTSLAGNSGTATPSSGVITVTTGAANATGTALFTGASHTLTLTFEDSQSNVVLGGNTPLQHLTSGSGNTALGDGVLRALTSGSGNTCIGGSAGLALTIGSRNTFIGGTCGNTPSTGSYNTCLGDEVANTTGSWNGDYNTLISFASGDNYSATESSNILIGANVLGTQGESNVLRIGNATGTGDGNIAQGSAFIQGIYGATPSSPQMVTISSDGNLGSQAIPSSSVTFTGDSGTPFSGSSVTITGASTGLTFDASTPNLTLGGILVGANGGTGVANTGLTIDLTFAGSGYVLTSDGSGNATWQAAGGGGSVTFTGNAGTPFSGSAVTIAAGASNGTVVFTASSPDLTLTFTDSNNNTALGGNAFSTTSGTPGANTAFGLNALAGIAGGGPVSGSNNTGIGLNALIRLSSGSDNTAIGQSTLTLTETGSSNIAVGSTAGSAVLAANNNTISIGSTGVSGGGSGGETVIGYILNDTGTSTQTACYIDGIAGVSVGTTAVLITAGGQLGVGVSSARYKDNIKDMGDISSSLHKLRPVVFTLKSNPELGIRTGLIAEEVAKIMPSLVRHGKNGLAEGVHYHELPALLLNEIQKLRREVDQLKEKVG